MEGFLSNLHGSVIHDISKASLPFTPSIPLDNNQVTRAIEDPLVLRQLKFAQDFRRRFCAEADGDKRVSVSEAGRDCQDVHSRPFLVASRRCGGRRNFLKKPCQYSIPQHFNRHISQWLHWRRSHTRLLLITRRLPQGKTGGWRDWGSCDRQGTPYSLIYSIV